MKQHELLFQPGRWVGGGKVTFSASPEIVRFYMSWTIENGNQGFFICRQHIEMQPLDEALNNQLSIYEIKKDKFKVILENHLIGKAVGSGIIDSKSIAWEFRATGCIEGFEVYELQDNGDYMFHAEYSSIEQFRTVIDGRIWRKSFTNE